MITPDHDVPELPLPEDEKTAELPKWHRPEVLTVPVSLTLAAGGTPTDSSTSGRF